MKRNPLDEQEKVTKQRQLEENRRLTKTEAIASTERDSMHTYSESKKVSNFYDIFTQALIKISV